MYLVLRFCHFLPSDYCFFYFRTYTDPTTLKWKATAAVGAAAPLYQGNKAGECVDCFAGTLQRSYPGALVQPLDSSRSTVSMGIFPMERYMSLCNMNEEQLRITNASGLAFQHRDSTHWGYGELDKGASRALSLHSNCISFRYGKTATPFEDKEKFFKSMSSWVVPD